MVVVIYCVRTCESRELLNMLILLHCRQKCLKTFCLSLLMSSTFVVLFISSPGFTTWLQLEEGDENNVEGGGGGGGGEIYKMKREDFVYQFIFARLVQGVRVAFSNTFWGR